MALGYDGSIRIDTKVNQRGFNQGISGMASALGKLAGVVAVVFSVAAIVNFGKESVKAASKLSSALIGLQSIVEGQGRSFGEAKSFIQDYIKDGLVPMQNAVTAYKNLAMRGYSTEQIEKTMIALKNASAFGRSAALTMGEAVSSATEGLRNENSLLVDNSGVTKNVSMMWKDYAEKLGVGVQSLTKAQKIQAEVNGIMEETRFQMGDASKIVDTYAGQVSMLSFNFEQLKVAVGNAIMPIVQAALPAVNELLSAMTSLANVAAQVTSALFGKAASGSEDLADANEDAAGSAGDLSGATDDVGDSVQAAAKKIKGSLAPFDDLKKISSSAADGMSDAAGDLAGDLAGGIGGGVLFGDVTVSPEVLGFIENLKLGLSSLLEYAKELSDHFKDGFNLSFGSFDPSSLIKSAENIKDSMKSIFTDPSVLGAAQNYIEHFTKSLGAVSGALSSIGISLATALVGGSEIFLRERGGDIKNWLVRMFDVKTEVSDIVSDLATSIADIFTVFRGGDSQQIVADIESIFSSIFMGTLEIGAKFGRDLLDVVTAPIIENTDKIKLALENMLSPLRTIMDAIDQLVRDTIESIVSMYDEHIHPFLMKVKESFTEWFGHILDGWNTYIAPVMEELATRFSEISEEYIRPAIESIISVFGKLIDLVSVLWDVISPVITEIIDGVFPLLEAALSLLGNVFLDVLGSISGVLEGFMTALGGVLDFITGVFTADWEKAWNGIKDVFSGIFNAFASGLEGLINVIISGINFLISIINSIKIDAPDWLTELTGVKDLGFNIQPVKKFSIPKLANGAVIPPNQEFAAILGDQKSGRNFEAPEGLVRQIIREEMGNMQFKVNQSMSFEGELGQFVRMLQPKIQTEMKRVGSSTVTVGSY